VFTNGANIIDTIDLPVRHGEGKFYTDESLLNQLQENNQVVFQYSKTADQLAGGEYPYNPNGSLMDIAGICDPTGRIFGLMPHPEAYNHYTNHPDWPKRVQELKRAGQNLANEEGEGVKIFRNAVEYVRSKF
jgi:phosphoribosylformylglycinamidine synthase